MLSQFTWLQFFLFVGGAALLWYVYVLFVYFGSSINSAITRPREEAEVAAIPVARRPVARSIIQTEDFTLDIPGQTSQGAGITNLVEDQSQQQAALEIVPSVMEDAAPAPASLDADAATLSEGTLSILDPTEALQSTENGDGEMSPAVRAALTGQSYNWADSPALNMDYREPDPEAIAEITAIDVSTDTDNEATGDGNEETERPQGSVPAEDYALTIDALTKPELSTETKEKVFSTLEGIAGNAFVASLAQRSPNAAGNLTAAFAERAAAGTLTEGEAEFRDRFLKGKTEGENGEESSAPPAWDEEPHEPTTSEGPDSSEPAANTTNDRVPSTPVIDGDDYNALLDSLT